MKDTASATHALSCRAPDMESNETKHLGEALEMIDEWQARGSDANLKVMMLAKTTKMIPVERPQ